MGACLLSFFVHLAFGVNSSATAINTKRSSNVDT